MPKQEGQKSKLLALLHIFEQQTDEEHLLNVPQLVELLARQALAARLRVTASTLAAEYPDDFARVIGLHTYSQSPRRDYDITLTGEWVERGGFRFEEFVLTPRREDGNDGRTE